MNVKCWECRFFASDAAFDGESDQEFYLCEHPAGTGLCPLLDLEGGVGDCKLLDSTAPERSNALSRDE